MKKLSGSLAFALACGLAFTGTALAGAHLNTKIIQVGAGASTVGGDVAFVITNDVISNPPACVTANSNSRMAIDLGTVRGKQMASLATSALMAKTTVGVIGTGTCVTVNMAGANYTMELMSVISILGQ